MRVQGTPYRTVWMDGATVRLIDQNRLPFDFAVAACADHRATAEAIRRMTVRGAPAIGAAAAFALAQAFVEARPARPVGARARRPRASSRAPAPPRATCSTPPSASGPPRRPPRTPAAAVEAAVEAARALAEESVASCRRIGEHGAALLGARGARAHPLQRGVAGHRGPRHRARARVRRRGGRKAAARVGGRDAAARAGRAPDGVGAGRRGGAARRDRRQRRRLPDEPRRGGPGHRGRRPGGRQRRRGQQGGDAGQGRLRARVRRPLLRGRAALHLRRLRRRRRRHPHRGALRRRGALPDRARRGRGRCAACGSPRPAPPRATRRST